MKLLLLLLCLICPCVATLSKSTLNNVAEVVAKSGISKLNLVFLQENSKSRAESLQLKKSLQHQNIQTSVLAWKSIDIGGNKILDGNFLVYTVTNQQEWLASLKLASHTRVLTTILISTIGTVSNLPKLDLNTQIYVFDTTNASWFEFKTLKNVDEKAPITHAIGESSRGNFILRPNFNFEGTSVISVALDWEPYFSFKNCDENGNFCQISGQLARSILHVQNLLKMRINSTRHVNDNWGFNSDQSVITPANDSNGVSDLVFRGQAHLSCSVWTFRSGIVENFDGASMMLLIRPLLVSKGPELPDVDFGLFTRPFSFCAWFAILALSILLIMSMAIALRLHGNNTSKWSFRIALASFLFFWVIINAFYSGALTMFFSNEAEPLFKSMEEVLQAFPKYKLLMMKDALASLELRRNKSPLFSKYWERVQKDPAQFRVETSLEGLQKVLDDKVVLEIQEQIFWQTCQHEQLQCKEFHIIERGSNPLSAALLLTKNSPLTPAFEHAFLQLRQNGIIARSLKSNDLTSTTKETRKDDVLTTLAPGQLVVAYVIMGLGIMASLFLLVAEIIIKHALRRRNMAK